MIFFVEVTRCLATPLPFGNFLSKKFIFLFQYLSKFKCWTSGLKNISKFKQEQTNLIHQTWNALNFRVLWCSKDKVSNLIKTILFYKKLNSNLKGFKTQILTIRTWNSIKWKLFTAKYWDHENNIFKGSLNYKQVHKPCEIKESYSRMINPDLPIK